MSLVLALFFVSQTPMQCAQGSGMMLMEGLCVSATEHVIVDGSAPPLPTALPQPVPKSKRKARVQLMCWPRMQIGSFRPTSVFTSVRVMDPGDKFWCPQMVWSVNGEFAGEHTSDCKPYETIVAEGGEPAAWSEDHPKEFRLPQGTHVIVAKLVKAGSIIAKETCTVEIR